MYFNPIHKVVSVEISMTDSEAEDLVKDINAISQLSGLDSMVLRQDYPALSELFDGVESAMAKETVA